MLLVDEVLPVRLTVMSAEKFPSFRLKLPLLNWKNVVWVGVGVGVGVGGGVGVGVGVGEGVPEVVKLHIGPLVVLSAIVFPTIRQKYVVPGSSVSGRVKVSFTPSSTEPVSKRG